MILEVLSILLISVSNITLNIFFFYRDNKS